MTKCTHNELGIVHELLQLTFFLLGDMSGGRIVSVLDDVSVCFNSEIAEFVFKIADLGLTEGVIGGCEHNSLSPVVLIGISLVLHKAVEYAFAVLPDACLSYVSNIISGIIGNAKEKVNSAPFEIFTILAFFYFGARYLIRNTCPVGKGAFYCSYCSYCLFAW